MTYDPSTLAGAFARLAWTTNPPRRSWSRRLAGVSRGEVAALARAAERRPRRGGAGARSSAFPCRTAPHSLPASSPCAGVVTACCSSIRSHPSRSGGALCAALGAHEPSLERAGMADRRVGMALSPPSPTRCPLADAGAERRLREAHLRLHRRAARSGGDGGGAAGRRRRAGPQHGTPRGRPHPRRDPDVAFVRLLERRPARAAPRLRPRGARRGRPARAAAAPPRVAAATVFPSAPAYLQALLKLSQPPSWPASVRLVISASAPLPPDVAAQFRARFGLPVHVFYGASECGGICYDREGRRGRARHRRRAGRRRARAAGADRRRRRRRASSPSSRRRWPSGTFPTATSAWAAAASSPATSRRPRGTGAAPARPRRRSHQREGQEGQPHARSSPCCSACPA